MKTDGTNADTKLTTTQEKNMTLKQWVMQMSSQIAMALPPNITPERMARIAMTALSKSELLSQSTRNSFLGALLTSAQLGLECNTPLGQAYLIPYTNKKTGRVETQFQLGYQGMLDLCYRTNQYKTIQARVVYKGDEFDYSYGFNENLRHIPHGKTKDPVFVYAYYELISGGRAFEVMSWKEVLTFAEKYSQSVKNKKSSPWESDTEAMAKKTVLKKVMKYAPKSVEIANAVARDSGVLSANVIQDGNDVLVDIVNTQPEIGNDAPAEIEAPKQSAKIPQRRTQAAEFPAQETMELTPEEEAEIDEAWENGLAGESEVPDALF
ncbi:MAG: recombinase RecT [Treponemataceae bacterium]|nr:recombinase RecT [Treponemataceae bacterium]